MKRFLILAIVFCMAMGSVAYAAEEAVGFKGINLGADISEMEKDSRYKCHPDPNNPWHDSACSLNYKEKETIAGASIISPSPSLDYFANKLWQISIRFDSDDFQTVIDSLTTKYGKGKITKEKVQNKLGATFVNEIVTWKKGTSNIVAKKFASNLDKSSLRFYTDSGNSISKSRWKAKDSSKANDL